MATDATKPTELHYQLRQANDATARTVEALRAAARAADSDLVRNALLQCVRESELIQKRAANVAKFCGVRG